jgi:glucose 1-dehydrogenase
MTTARRGNRGTMQAIAVIPGERGSIHLREVPVPSLSDVPGERGVEVEVIRVGVDGTDREIVDAEFGTPPDGDDFLILGHESLGRIVRSGPDVPGWAAPGALVVATVRRPGGSVYDRLGYPDLTTDEDVLERGINRLHGFLAERYVDDAAYLVPLPESLEPVGVLLEPLSIAEKAIRQALEIQRRLRAWQPRRCAVLGAGTIGMLTALAFRLRGWQTVTYSRRTPPYRNSDLLERIGVRYVGSTDTTIDELGSRHGPFDLVLDATGYSPLAFQAVGVLAMNGVLVLSGVTGGDRTVELPTDRLNQSLVLGNRVIVGTVNAAREDFVAGVSDLLRAEAAYPGWLRELLTTPIAGLSAHAEMLDRLEHDDDAIKVFVEIAARS